MRLSDAGISIVKATYGSSMGRGDVTGVVSALAEDALFVHVNNDVLGDPAPHTFKSLFVEGESMGGPWSITVPENDVLVPPPLAEGVRVGKDSGFSLLDVRWGSDERWLDLTVPSVEFMWEPLMTARMPPDVEDPAPGTRKWLVVRFSHGGRLYVRAMREGEWESLLPRSEEEHVRRLSPMLAPVILLPRPHSEKELSECLCECGLSDESIFNFPPELHSHCGLGMKIWQYPCQFAPYLMEAARRCGDQPSYLEIGTRAGGTFAFTAEYLGAARAVGVDLCEHGFMQGYCRTRRGAEFIRGDSHSARVVSALRERGPFDLALVDGDHTTDGCLKDAEICFPLARMIAFHDIVDRQLPDVTEAWKRVRRDWAGTHDFMEFTAQYGKENWMGIGLAVRR